MSEQIRLHAVLFELDGVLVDVSRSYRRAIEETVEHFTGRQIFAGTIQRYRIAGGVNDERKLTHAIVSDTGMNVPFSRVEMEFQRRYRGDKWDGFIAEEPPLIQRSVLEALCENRILGVVTGRRQDEAAWTLAHYKWKKFFPLVVAREKHEGRFKPDPFPIQHALGILHAAGRQIAPRRCAYIGSSVDDIQAARAADVWAIGMVSRHADDADEQAARLRAAGADVVIDNALELANVIEHFHEHVAPEEPVP